MRNIINDYPQIFVEFIDKLIGLNWIKGILIYNKDTKVSDDDFKLIVVHDRTDIKDLESIYFYYKKKSINLGLRTYEKVENMTTGIKIDDISFEELLLLESEILYDPEKRLEKLFTMLEDGFSLEGIKGKKNLQKSSFILSQAHFLNEIFTAIKSQERLLTEKLFNRNIQWLIKSYFSSRGLDYRGKEAALRYLTKHEPEFIKLLRRFFSEADFMNKYYLMEEMTQFVLKAVDGNWKEDEIIPFAYGLKDTKDYELYLKEAKVICSEIIA